MLNSERKKRKKDNINSYVIVNNEQMGGWMIDV